MKQTTNLKLNKPDYDDIADIGKLNENSDILDAEVEDRLSKSKGGTVAAPVTFDKEVTLTKTTYARTIKLADKDKNGDYSVGTSGVPYPEGYFKKLHADSIDGDCLDTKVSEGSGKPVTSGAVAEELKKKSGSDHTHREFKNDVKIADKHTLTVYQIEGNDGLHLLAGPLHGGTAKGQTMDLYARIDFNVDPEGDGDEVGIHILNVPLTLFESLDVGEDSKVPNTFHNPTLFKDPVKIEDSLTAHAIIPEKDGEYSLGTRKTSDPTNSDYANNRYFRAAYIRRIDTDELEGKVLEQLADMFLEKITSYYDRNPVEGKSVEKISKPVYFEYQTVFNNDTFAHRILPEGDNENFTIGTKDIPWAGGYFNNLYLNGKDLAVEIKALKEEIEKLKAGTPTEPDDGGGGGETPDPETDTRVWSNVSYKTTGTTTIPTVSLTENGMTYTPQSNGIKLKKGDVLKVQYYLEDVSFRSTDSYSLDGGCGVTPDALSSLGFSNSLEGNSDATEWNNKSCTGSFTKTYTVEQDELDLPTFEIAFGGGSDNSINSSFECYINEFSVNGHILIS